ncbi:LytR/AlgR family response regulator transcription factor [Marinoscillum sp.]|uniref:LytR/AlgR family response regulator transcription factor n=1 Tax=Marinoscillum sp. TaxID=2024838 RepID=UPI003BA9E7D9
MRAVIIDDEPSLRESTKTLLGIYCPEVTVVGEADGVKTAVELIRSSKPDLVFLDIEMRDGLGFDVLHVFPDRAFAVIFVTGHNEYAVKAFKISAIDYLLKPIDPEELERAVTKAQTNLHRSVSGMQIQTLAHQLNNRELTKIVLKDSEKVYLIDIAEIVRCESSDNYTRFFLTDKRSILVSTTLKEYEKLLDSQSFFRTHQSHLVNLRHIDHYDKREGGTLVMKDQSRLPVSVRKKEQLLKALEKLS